MKDESIIDELMAEPTSSAVTLLDRNNARHLLGKRESAKLLAM